MILYVTHAFSGIQGLINGKGTEATGRPGFIEPFKFISAREEVKVLLLAPKKPSFIENALGWNENNVIFIRYRKGGLRQIFDELLALLKIFWICKKFSPNFVYCHGSISYLGLIVGKIHSIPTGLHLYGTFLTDIINDPLCLRKFMRMSYHWREILAIKIRKEFVLMTNDGTRGNEALTYFKAERRSNVYFWLNGVDFTQEIVDNSYTSSSELIYPARITPWKKQDRALRFFKEALVLVPNLKLSFVGKIQNDSYYNKLIQLVEEYELEANVTFYGEIPQIELASLMVESLGVLSFYDVSNLGNVSIECLSLGGCLIALDDGSLNGIVSSGINGHLVSGPNDFANVIKSLKSSFKFREEIGRHAETSSRKLFSNWHERSLQEYDLIKGYLHDN